MLSSVGLTSEWNRWVFPIRSMLLPCLIHPMGFKRCPFLLDPESIPRVVTLSFRSSIVGKKLYVGNLTYNVNESDLEALFMPFGTVQSAQVIVDRDTNRSKGFGFVEMGSDAEAQAAISALNDHEHDGRRLTVNEAKPREERGGGGGRGGYGGGRGGGGGGGGGYGGGGGGRRY
jgi:cold-inducible RNA-binding protein